MSASGVDMISSVYHGRLLTDHGRLKNQNSFLELPSSQNARRCVFLWQVVAIPGALLSCALGLFGPGQPKSANCGKTLHIGKDLALPTGYNGTVVVATGLQARSVLGRDLAWQC